MRTYGTLRYRADRQQWVMKCDPHVHMRVKRIFPRIDKKTAGALTFSATPETAADLAWVLDRYPMDVDDADRAALHVAAAQHRDRIQRLEDLIDPNYEPPTFALAYPPRSYQAREAAILLESGGLLIGDDVGLGKSVSAIAVMSDPRTLPAVVVCPTHLPRQWEREIRKFAPTLNVHCIKRGTPYPLPLFFGHGPDVLVINYAKLAGWADVLAAYAKCVVFDEVQELRNPGTQRFEAARQIAHRVPFRLGLSATPIHNYGGEIYAILSLLKPDCLGTPSEFALEWGGAVDANGRMRLKDPRAFGAWARESFLIVRHTRAEVGNELPPVTRVTQVIDTDEKQLREVKASAASLARTILTQAQLERGAKWEAARELSMLLRQATGIAKAPFVADFVRMLVESGERVVLCGWHRDVYDIWLERLKDLSPSLYTGTESATAKEQSVERFLSGKSQVLILSLRSGSGLNGLQDVSSCLVFGELDWSPAVHEQAIGRLARDGQKTPVVAYFLVADDGSDPAVAEVLGLKREQLDGIRDPGRDFLEQVDTSGDHVRRLAERYLRQIGVSLPEPEMDPMNAVPPGKAS